MKKITLLSVIFCTLFSATQVLSQKVVLIGANHNSTSPNTDGIAFVATEDIASGEVIYFTENEYVDSGNAFDSLGESVVAFTAGSLITTGTVVFIDETGTSTNTFTVTCTGGGSCGTAIKTGSSGAFSLATGGESIYAYSDSDDDPSNGVTEIYSVLYTVPGTLPIPENPLNDFPNAVVVDGFASGTPDRTEFNASRDGVSQAILENPSNYTNGLANADLDITAFTNLNLAGVNPVVTLTSTPASVVENSGNTITYAFARTGATTSPLTVNFTVAGSATFNTDYTETGAASFTTATGTVTIGAGSSSAAVTITPSGDTDLESNETVDLTVAAGTGYDAGSPGSATGTIDNDDTMAITPVVAVVGANHTGAEGFSFVALDDIAAGTEVYFTENPFDMNTLSFTGAEGVMLWTAPGGGITRGTVIVATETSANTFTTNIGTVSLVSGNFSLANNGEALFAYGDSDTDHTNGITQVDAVLFTGTTTTPGGTIPAAEDPTTKYIGSVLVDGFASSAPIRTEYDPALRNVIVDQANFQNAANWLHAASTGTLSDVPFTDIIVTTGSANPTATLTVAPTSVIEDGATNLVFTFTLDEVAPSDVTVNFTVGGTATFSTDYAVTGASAFDATSGSVVISNGTSFAEVTVDPMADTDVETAETVELMLASGIGYNGGSPNDATGTITNDDTSDSMPLVAITGLNHTTPDGFSFVAAQDIPAGTVIYFTENGFDNSTLMFASGESVLRYTSPSTVIPKGDVIVVSETAPNVFSITCNGTSGDPCGIITLVSGSLSTASNGETFYAYEDDDSDPTNGVTDIYAVLYTGNSTTPGGTIPASEDPSGIFTNALVVDGFPGTAPNRTEYDATKRDVLVVMADFENIANWVHAQTNPPDLSAIPFTNLDIVEELDITAPVITCPSNETVAVDANCEATVLDYTALVTITDDMDPNPTVSQNPVAGTTIGLGDTEIIMTATDATGNSASCSIIVTVEDQEAPTAPSPPADVTVQCADDVPPPIDLTATDNCDGDIIVSPIPQITPSACANDFIEVRTWTFTDATGNTRSVSQTITVLDDTAPVAPAAPADLTLQCADDVPPPIDLTATDNCDDAITVSPTVQLIPGACANDFVEVRTWTFADVCGNASSVSQTITVQDDTAPVAPAVPADLTLQCADEVPPPIDLTATDNCDDAITVSPTVQLIPGACANDFVEVRTWTFADVCGNASSVSQTITVQDDTAPVAPASPADLTLQCADDVPPPVDLTATDNCDDAITVSPTVQLIPGVCANDFVEVRTWTFTDVCGNTSSISQTITVSDTEAPHQPLLVV